MEMELKPFSTMHALLLFIGDNHLKFVDLSSRPLSKLADSLLEGGCLAIVNSSTALTECGRRMLEKMNSMPIPSKSSILRLRRRMVEARMLRCLEGDASYTIVRWMVKKGLVNAKCGLRFSKVEFTRDGIAFINVLVGYKKVADFYKSKLIYKKLREPGSQMYLKCSLDANVLLELLFDSSHQIRGFAKKALEKASRFALTEDERSRAESLAREFAQGASYDT